MIRPLKQFVLCFALVLVLHSIEAEAQQWAQRMFKIGWLSATAPGTYPGQKEIIRMLAESGHIEGKNIFFEFRYAENKLERLPALAAELVGHNVDILVTPGTPGALALQNATTAIPIIFLDVTDPVGAGLVQSLARPGANITGFSSIESVLAGKRLELLQETIPEPSQVAVLWDPKNLGSRQEWEECQRAARPLKLQLQSLEVSTSEKYEEAFERARKARGMAMSVLSSALATSNQQRIADLAKKYRLPTIYVRHEFVALGGLISYGVDQHERFRRAAVLIDKILKGAKPADLPVEQPTKFQMAINLKTAKQIGLTIPPNVLSRADRVIR